MRHYRQIWWLDSHAAAGLPLYVAVLHQFAAACHVDIEFGDLFAKCISVDAQKISAFGLISTRRVQRDFDQRKLDFAQNTAI